jgi:hypothetical protein
VQSLFEVQVALDIIEDVVAIAVSSGESCDVVLGVGILVSSWIELICCESVVDSGVSSDVVDVAVLEVTADSRLEVVEVGCSVRRILVVVVDIMIKGTIGVCMANKH